MVKALDLDLDLSSDPDFSSDPDLSSDLGLSPDRHHSSLRLNFVYSPPPERSSSGRSLQGL